MLRAVPPGSRPASGDDLWSDTSIAHSSYGGGELLHRRVALLLALLLAMNVLQMTLVPLDPYKPERWSASDLLGQGHRRSTRICSTPALADIDLDEYWSDDSPVGCCFRYCIRCFCTVNHHFHVRVAA